MQIYDQIIREEELRQKQEEERNGPSGWQTAGLDEFGVDPKKFNTYTEYQQAVNVRQEELAEFRDVLDRLGYHSKYSYMLFFPNVNRLKETLADRPNYIPENIHIYLIYINECFFFDEPKIEQIEILRVLAKKQGHDLDSILQAAEDGTLLPEGARLHKNYYLSRYIITADRAIWTWRNPDYYYRRNGFTLEEFATHCGEDPDFHFRPPAKGFPG